MRDEVSGIVLMISRSRYGSPLSLAPVLIVAHEFDVTAAHPFLELEGAVAYRMDQDRGILQDVGAAQQVSRHDRRVLFAGQ